MINTPRVLGLITARGGSKGLPGKNIKLLCGKPLIAWTIDTALRSQIINDVIVSTDCKNIASIAVQCGAEVPFIRPAEYATDEATSFDAIEHAVSWLSECNRHYDYLVLLEPTSPLRDADDVDSAIREMISKNASSIVSICETTVTHPVFMYYKEESLGKLIPFVKNNSRSLRRQDVDLLYHLEGSIYASKVDTLLAKKGFYHEETIGFEMPKWKSPEIDDEVDFLLVEAIMKQRGMDL